MYRTPIATQNYMMPKAQRCREKTIVQSIIDGTAFGAIMANILGRDLLSEQRSFPSNKYWPPSAGLFSLLKIELNFIEEENIAKGTSDPGVDCFNQIHKSTIQATSPQDS